MNETSIRIYFESDDGDWSDSQMDYPLESFGGFLPNVGDSLLEPGVLTGRDRHDPANREMLDVVKRVFGAKDHPNVVAIVVRKRKLQDREADLC